MAENSQTLAARDVHGTAHELSAHVDDLYDGAVALRRRLHEWPEVGNHLPNTRDAVLESLEGLPLDVTLHNTTSGIAALLTGGKPGPTNTGSKSLISILYPSGKKVLNPKIKLLYPRNKVRTL